MLILWGTGIESFTVLSWEIVVELFFFSFYAINFSNIWLHVDNVLIDFMKYFKIISLKILFLIY